ncbi:MAG: hypothetical protein VKJ06_08365 [Vampirovibrionales bacterium]|nr:hypothetical protein [Vampirovibrionales bacterium]
MPFGRDAFLPNELETLLAMFDELSQDVDRYDSFIADRDPVISDWLKLSGNN